MLRPERDPDPVRNQLRDVRRGLFRLHKTLIDAERALFEQRSGPLAPGSFLQLLIHDEFFAWLRPFSSLIVEMDEVLAARDEPIGQERARGYLAQVRDLIATSASHETPSVSRYDEVHRRDPSVLLAHVELTRRLADATV
jgi:hypothetical protein